MPRLPHHKLDALMVDYLDVLFFQGLHIAIANVFVSAMKRFRIQRGAGEPALPRVSRALRGWRHIAPSGMRLPLPWEALMTTVGLLFLQLSRSTPPC